MIGATTTYQNPDGLAGQWNLSAAFPKSSYTVFRKGLAGEQPSIGFARLRIVDYAVNGTALIGSGIDGSPGNAGVSTGTPAGGNCTSASSPTSTVNVTSDASALRWACLQMPLAIALTFLMTFF